MADVCTEYLIESGLLTLSLRSSDLECDFAFFDLSPDTRDDGFKKNIL